MFRLPVVEVALDLLREGATPVERGFGPSLLAGRERCTCDAFLIHTLLIPAGVHSHVFVWRVRMPHGSSPCHLFRVSLTQNELMSNRNTTLRRLLRLERLR